MAAAECPPEHVFKPGFLGNYFVKLMQPEDNIKKMKASKVHFPEHITDAHAVIATFIQQQETLLQYLRLAKTKKLDNANIPVSIFKWIKLNPGDVLRFLIVHNERHILQAKRNL